MKKITAILIIAAAVLVTGCNLGTDRILLVNNTDYTVAMDYRAGTNDDGSDDYQVVEVAPNEQQELYDVELWMGDSSMELLTRGCWAVDADVAIDMDTLPGTYFWPLTIFFSVDE